MFLIESKAKCVCMERLRIKLGYAGKLVIDSMGRSSGLCLLWFDDVVVDLIPFTTFHIDVRVQSHHGKVWRLIGFYGNPDSSQRDHSWTLL